MKVTYSSTLPPLSHIFLILLLFLSDGLHGSVVHYNLVPVNVCLSQSLCCRACTAESAAPPTAMGKQTHFENVDATAAQKLAGCRIRPEIHVSCSPDRNGK